MLWQRQGRFVGNLRPNQSADFIPATAAEEQQFDDAAKVIVAARRPNRPNFRIVEHAVARRVFGNGMRVDGRICFGEALFQRPGVKGRQKAFGPRRCCLAVLLNNLAQLRLHFAFGDGGDRTACQCGPMQFEISFGCFVGRKTHRPLADDAVFAVVEIRERQAARSSWPLWASLRFL